MKKKSHRIDAPSARSTSHPRRARCPSAFCSLIYKLKEDIDWKDENCSHGHIGCTAWSTFLFFFNFVKNNYRRASLLSFCLLQVDHLLAEFNLLEKSIFCQSSKFSKHYLLVFQFAEPGEYVLITKQFFWGLIFNHFWYSTMSSMPYHPHLSFHKKVHFFLTCKISHNNNTIGLLQHVKAFIPQRWVPSHQALLCLTRHL